MSDCERFDKLDTKLDNIDNKLNSMDVTIAKQQVSLDNHILRTNLLEDRFHPIEEYKNQLQGVVKFFKILAFLAAFAECMYQLIHWFK